MGQNNSKRISHDVDLQQNVFRDDTLLQAINDLAEEDTGKGFSEVIYSGPFVQQIVAWDSPSKNKKRTQAEFVYPQSPFSPFITQIIKRVYDEDTGSVEIARSTVDIVYNANRQVISANVTTERL